MAGRESLPLSQLKQLRPLNRLTDDQLVLLANRAERRKYAPGQNIARRGVRDGLDYYLLQGAVELTAVDGRSSSIESGSDKALNAVAKLQPRMYDVTATRPSEFLVIDQEVLVQLLRSAPVQQVEMDSTDGSQAHESEEHHLLMEFYAELRSNQLSLPSVPDVAWKVRRAADREDSSVEDIARVITADPAMAAKLVRACNSPLYRGFKDVRKVSDAVIRLGTRTTRQLVTVFSMREVFKTRQPALQKAMDALWRHSREVAALSWVLADSATRLDPEEALLAGLLHDIGAIPVLVQAEHHTRLFADTAKLDHAVNELKGDIGAAILENWSFPATFIAPARHAEDWGFDHQGNDPQLVDVVIVAQLHSLIAANQKQGLPEFDAVPAYRKLGELELDASRSLQMLTAARSRVDEVLRLLSIT